MQKQPRARVAPLLIFVVLSLFAAACGGSSDDGETSETTTSSESTETVDDSTSSDSSDDAAAGPSTSASTADAVGGERECVRTAPADVVPGQEDIPTDVPLPPQEKPEVGEELLGDFDELITTDLIEGTGAEATTGSLIAMQYVGVLASDGTQFDASWDRGADPFVFSLGGGEVISGWDEGIVGMKVGGRRVLQIPSAQAYGDQARSEVIVANSDLIFIVDLVDVEAVGVPAPEISADLLGAFPELGTTDLVVGDGCEARIGDILVVNYVGQNSETGEEIDNSWTRGEPFRLTAGLSQVIDGWNEGIVGMKVGGERILQIPADMAYGDGDLVFRVHLEEVIDAPFAHSISFEGDPPEELEITTITEGTGDPADGGDIVEGNIAVILHNSNVLVQSTWEQGQPAQFALVDGNGLIEGLAEGMNGIRAGEQRQIVIPTSVAYPDGVPPNSGLDTENDAIVFVIEALSVTPG